MERTRKPSLRSCSTDTTSGKSRWQRKRRHLKETASIHLLQYRELIVIILTKGKHEAFYKDHHSQVQDIRRTALKVFGYSVRYSFSEIEKRQKVFIRLDPRRIARSDGPHAEHRRMGFLPRQGES